MNQPVHVQRRSRCESPEPIRNPARFRTAILAILMSSLSLWMYSDLQRYPCEHAFSHQIDSPVLALELASSRAEVERVLAPRCAAYQAISDPKRRGESYENARQTAHDVLLRNTIADCFFIPLYTSFIWSFGSLFAGNANSLLRRVLTLATILTAAADYTENIGIFRSLRSGPSDLLAQWTCWPSQFKWIVLALALSLTGVTLLRSQEILYSLATRRLLALAYLAAGTLLVIGVWLPVLIGLGLSVFGVIVAVQIVALLGPYVADRFPPDKVVYEENFCKDREKSRKALAVHEDASQET